MSGATIPKTVSCCLNCRHWDPYSDNPDGLADGDCKRYPPSVPIDGEMIRGMPFMGYPITYGDELCGEWTARE